MDRFEKSIKKAALGLVEPVGIERLWNILKTKNDFEKFRVFEDPPETWNANVLELVLKQAIVANPV